MALTCKFCGKECKRIGNNLGGGGMIACPASPTKKHVLVADGKHCVFCGRETKPMGSGLAGDGMLSCPASPSQKHQLGE
jgi:hypothetical protein